MVSEVEDAGFPPEMDRLPGIAEGDGGGGEHEPAATRVHALPPLRGFTHIIIILQGKETSKGPLIMNGLIL